MSVLHWTCSHLGLYYLYALCTAHIKHVIQTQNHRETHTLIHTEPQTYANTHTYTQGEKYRNTHIQKQTYTHDTHPETQVLDTVFYG